MMNSIMNKMSDVSNVKNNLKTINALKFTNIFLRHYVCLQFSVKNVKGSIKIGNMFVINHFVGNAILVMNQPSSVLSKTGQDLRHIQVHTYFTWKMLQ